MPPDRYPGTPHGSASPPGGKRPSADVSRAFPRALAVALAGSVALHVALLAGVPGFGVSSAPEPAAMPLEARLLPPPAPPPAAVAAAPGLQSPRRAKPDSKPRASPRARQIAPAPVAESPMPAPLPADLSAEPDITAGGLADADGVQAGAVAASPPAAIAEAATAASPDAPADYPLRKVRLVYDLLHSTSQTRVGHVVHTFRTDGDRYEVEAVAEAVGFVSLFFRGRFVQRSRGVIGPAGLVPEEYTLERGRGDPPERAVFDWDDGKLDLAWRNERRTVDLPQGAQDPISMLHQLYFMRPMPYSSTLSIATGRKLGRYVYAVRGDEDLLTPMGLVRTMHIARTEADGSVLEVWLDLERNLLPVRIYSVDRSGTVLDQVVREVALLE